MGISKASRFAISFHKLPNETAINHPAVMRQIASLIVSPKLIVRYRLHAGKKFAFPHIAAVPPKIQRAGSGITTAIQERASFRAAFLAGDGNGHFASFSVFGSGSESKRHAATLMKNSRMSILFFLFFWCSNEQEWGRCSAEQGCSAEQRPDKKNAHFSEAYC
jgi:hypothetical protein